MGVEEDVSRDLTLALEGLWAILPHSILDMVLIDVDADLHRLDGFPDVFASDFVVEKENFDVWHAQKVHADTRWPVGDPRGNDDILGAYWIVEK